MARTTMSKLLLAAAVLSSANAYFLFAMNDVITTERIDPIVTPVVGGSNFRVDTNTSFLRQSECTSSPIKEDNSAYTLYFQWKNGSFTSVSGSPVIYYLFSDTPGTTTPFPDDFRMVSGTPTLRSYNASDHAQQAVTFLCLDFSGTSTKHNELPSQAVNICIIPQCPSGIRAQLNFPACWDGKNTDSADHKSHVAYLSGGPDSGTCSDPKYPKTLPRIFMEMYLDTASLYAQRSQAMNPAQPFVYAMGDPTGYGYHGDFMMGWKAGTLQKVVDGCHCDQNGDPTCCSNAGIFTFQKGGNCRITKAINENAPPKQGKPVGQAVTANGGATSTPPAATPATSVKASSVKVVATSKKGSATSASVSAPTSGSGSGSGSPGTGSSSGSAPGKGSGSGAPSNGSGSSTPAQGSSSGSGAPATGSSGSPATGSSSGSGAPATGSSGSPATGSSSGSGSSTPAKGSKGGKGGSPSKSGSGSSNSSSNGTCHKKKPHTNRSAARHARALHKTSRRSFATPEQRFVDRDL
ncbi:hypothetical protein C8R46DRAFT_1027059 [Mycena filopes]|nr:hypothetical protein C8R46DRAFT_1027059 [Mycena filopes]